MKKVGTYKRFQIYQITPKDMVEVGEKSGYVLGDILSFTPDDEYPCLGYEDCITGSVEEMHDFINSYDQPKSTNILPLNMREIPQEYTSEKKFNAGYEIVQSVRIDEKVSFAIGKNKNAPNPYVAWQCRTDPDTGKKDYFWGDYCNSWPGAVVFLSEKMANWAERNLVASATNELQKETIQNYGENSVVVSGLDSIRSPEDLTNINRELRLFLKENAPTHSFDPAEKIKLFLEDRNVVSAAVTPFENEPEHLKKNDLLFNTKTCELERSDAWIVSVLNVCAEQNFDFTITPDGVLFPAGVLERFDSKEAARAEKIVICVFLAEKEKSLEQPPLSQSRRR